MTYTRIALLVLACALSVTCDYVQRTASWNARTQAYQRTSIPLLITITAPGNQGQFRGRSFLPPRQEVGVDLNASNVAAEVPLGQPESVVPLEQPQEQYGLPTEQPSTTSSPTASSGPYPPEAPYSPEVPVAPYPPEVPVAPYPPEVPASTYGQPGRRTFNFRGNTRSLGW